MSSQVEELGDNRVRLTVDVSIHELEHAVERAVVLCAGDTIAPEHLGLRATPDISTPPASSMARTANM